jgi:hypothetical protein
MSYRKHREFSISVCREKKHLKLETKLYQDLSNYIVKSKRTIRIIDSFFLDHISMPIHPLFFAIKDKYS